MLLGDSVAAAYQDACLAELAALKPGNVHVFAAGHGMTVAQFEASARVRDSTAPLVVAYAVRRGNAHWVVAEERLTIDPRC